LNEYNNHLMDQIDEMNRTNIYHFERYKQEDWRQLETESIEARTNITQLCAIQLLLTYYIQQLEYHNNESLSSISSLSSSTSGAILDPCFPIWLPYLYRSSDRSCSCESKWDKYVRNKRD